MGVSESTVRNRIERLTDNGVLRVLAVLEPEAVGLLVDLLVTMRVTPSRLQEALQALAEMNEVVYLGHVAGRFSIIAEVVLRDQHELLAFLSERLVGIPGIEAFETHFVLDNRKINYDWRLPEALTDVGG